MCIQLTVSPTLAVCCASPILADMGPCFAEFADRPRRGVTSDASDTRSLLSGWFRKRMKYVYLGILSRRKYTIQLS
ncbi:uncharacterized protein F4817DRAFT_124324 [Daldinia loculata]|uniref:uncharacterized protein n=1 Tax=Daldinia loculata TaxID=103429 RepID=UPI0020C286DB|nr:uncharacterized protein F4817DRAFT_124324 [Daldinia loculata]KAI1646811.1 hypothetical protein F4817DRAFT_124324 [Daldinia loculata]